MRICIVGNNEDLTSTYISWLCEKRDIDVIKLSEEKLGVNWDFSYDDTDLASGYIETSDSKYAFSSLDGFFVRLTPNPGLPEGLELTAEKNSVLVLERRKALQYFLNSINCPVVNRPCAGRSNGSKPFQMQMLDGNGFKVPEWIVSNREADIRQFSQKYQGKVIYKSCSGLRSEVRLLDDQLLDRLEEGTSPVILQEYIDGHDVRVHIVGERAFPTLIKSDGVDYRFESENNDFEATQIPDIIKKRCIKAAHSENLNLAGIDFRVTDDDQWYCLESNPVPNFLPYEMSTDQPIGEAVLDLYKSEN